MNLGDLHEMPRDNEVDVYGITHVGKVREQNEDQFLICSLHKQMEVHQTSLPDVRQLSLKGERLAFLALVADGLGGHAAGEEASRVALETLISYVNHSMECYYTGDPGQEREFLEQLNKSVLECHVKVLEEAQNHPELKGMATTLTLLLAIWPRAFVVQVGDSRCYRLRDGVLSQITRDQTVAQDMVDKGMLPEDQADRTRWSHILSSAIGGSRARPEISKIDLNWGDVLLLCTDGLSNYVPAEKIQERLQSLRTARLACKQLVADALEAGGGDNITLIVGHPRRARREPATQKFSMKS